MFQSFESALTSKLGRDLIKNGLMMQPKKKLRLAKISYTLKFGNAKLRYSECFYNIGPWQYTESKSILPTQTKCHF